MKIYFKILAITAGIQVMSFGLSRISDQILSDSMMPVGIMLLGIVLSMILGIVLPICWYHTGKERILGMVLLPTNYTWLVLVFSVIFFVNGMLDILTKMPANFG